MPQPGARLLAWGQNIIKVCAAVCILQRWYRSRDLDLPMTPKIHRFRELDATYVPRNSKARGFHSLFFFLFFFLLLLGTTKCAGPETSHIRNKCGSNNCQSKISLKRWESAPIFLFLSTISVRRLSSTKHETIQFGFICNIWRLNSVKYFLQPRLIHWLHGCRFV